MWPWTRKVKVKVTSGGYKSIEVIKVYKVTKCQVWSWYSSINLVPAHLRPFINKLKSISVCVHWSAKSRSRSPNFVLVGKNSSMFTNSPSLTDVSLMVCEELSKSQLLKAIVDAGQTDGRIDRTCFAIRSKMFPREITQKITPSVTSTMLHMRDKDMPKSISHSFDLTL